MPIWTYEEIEKACTIGSYNDFKDKINKGYWPSWHFWWYSKVYFYGWSWISTSSIRIEKHIKGLHPFNSSRRDGPFIVVWLITVLQLVWSSAQKLAFDEAERQEKAKFDAFLKAAADQPWAAAVRGGFWSSEHVNCKGSNRGQDVKNRIWSTTEPCSYVHSLFKGLETMEYLRPKVSYTWKCHALQGLLW